MEVADRDLTLEKLVIAATALLIDFDGPPTNKIGDTRYFALCSSGIKEEGMAVQHVGYEDALRGYERELRAQIAAHPGKQLAWRVRPRLEGEAGQFTVYSRLAFI